MADDPPAEPMISTVVTKRSDTVSESTLAQTERALPDIKIIAMTGVARVFVRSLRAFATTMSGTLGAAGVGLDGGTLPEDFQSLLAAAARIGLGAAIASALLNTSELLLKIDEKIPQMRG